MAGFIQQLAVGYLCRGYYFYVTGEIPTGKDPAKTDAKIIERYEIAKSKFTRSRERRKGMAGIQYLRYQRFFIILATHGKHRFFRDETKSIRDVREKPIQFYDYSIGFIYNHQKGHPSVRIGKMRFEQLKRDFQSRAMSSRTADLANELRLLPFEPYGPVRRQLFEILRLVNRARREAGGDSLPITVLRLHRASLRVF